MHITSRTLPFVLAGALAACASNPPPVESAPPPAPPAPAQPPPAAPAAQPEAAAPPPVDPAEEKKKAELAKLAEDMKAMEAKADQEAARFDDALKAEVKALVAANHPNAGAALRAALKGKHRTPGNAERDAARHPVETLEFFGLKPTSTVLELGAGEGWYTELLAPVLAKKGKLMITAFDPNGPAESRNTLYGKRVKRMLDKSPDLFGKVDVIVIDRENPKLGIEGKVDLVLAIREAHNWHRSGKFDTYVAEAFKALKPGGVFGIVAHRAKPDANPDESAKQGYLPEAWVIQKVESGGFKLGSKSEVNANPKDTKDYPEGVWTLPPNFRLGDKDRARYAAIGESDRMTLKFVKPAR
ncbi:class I SAM-dependent methyltransferase [Sorangium sp. So ce1078]|uniref:class I SAM-dependent methyltransferase n=1 Tax=Sorangium sp. So ce1078 TaxID=3133329 RepID=UPI003F6341C5